MLHCIDCDYIKVSCGSVNSDLCKKLSCEISKLDFSEDDLYELNDYPCNKIVLSSNQI